MQKDIESFQFVGLAMDDNPAKHQDTFLRDAENIRISKSKENEGVVITNEISSLFINVLDGKYLGHARIGEYVIVFTHSENEIHENAPDFIYRIKGLPYSDARIEILYNGNLNFSLDNPIECVVDYENSYIQKVYWVDGRNVPRVINVVADYSIDGQILSIRSYAVNHPKPLNKSRLSVNNYTDALNYTYPQVFDFYQPLELNEEIKVKRIDDSSSMFPAGVVQYAVTYLRKYGLETNVATITPPLAIVWEDRAGRPDEIVKVGFDVRINNVDTKFDYLLLYSIIRTSKDQMPEVRNVARILISENIKTITETINNEEVITGNYITYYDNHTTGSIVDPYYLLFLGDEKIIPNTIESKDGTLFLGNITKDISNLEKGLIEEQSFEQHIIDNYRNINVTIPNTIYPWFNTLTLVDSNGYLINPTTFKKNETYKFGILLLDIYGNWTLPIYTECHKVTAGSKIESTQNDDSLKLPICTRDFLFTENLDLEKYKKVRGVIALPSEATKNVLYLGVVTPAVYNVANRESNMPYVLSSWFFRPVHFEEIKNTYDHIILGGHYRSDTPYYKLAYIPFNTNYLKSLWCWGAEVLGTFPFWDDTDPTDGYNHNNNSGRSTNAGRLSLYTNPVLHMHRDMNDTHFFYSYHGSDKRSSPSSGETSIEEEIYEASNATSLFAVDPAYYTFHSPDIEFYSANINIPADSVECVPIGRIDLNKLIAECTITTKSPAYSPNGGAKDIQVSSTEAANKILASGLFYEDTLLDDFPDSDSTKYVLPIRPATFTKTSGESTTTTKSYTTFLYSVYPWQGSGSLNYDFNRPANAGGQTAILDTKILSNLRISDNIQSLKNTRNYSFSCEKISHFNSQEIILTKLGEKTYYGNIDTLLHPYCTYSKLFCPMMPFFGGTSLIELILNTSEQNYIFSSQGLTLITDNYDNLTLGDTFSGIGLGGNIRMKYKSSPHLIIKPEFLNSNNFYTLTYQEERDYDTGLLIVDIVKTSNNDPYDNIDEKELTWIPAGPAVNIPNSKLVTVEWLYGDTWFQRYDCMKTYPYTPQDENQILEIGSFLCESRINLDGRYDRNRGTTNKGTVTPNNYNLINFVYSQLDTFFSYKILDEDYYKNTEQSCTITWSLKKEAAAEKDLWTEINLSSTLDLDGSKGKLNKLLSWNNLLWAFQDEGISVINFNDRVQIPTSDDNPIEITNSYKVDGYKYRISEWGVTNKYSICPTVDNLYFRNSKTLLLYSMNREGAITDVSTTKKMSSYFTEIGTTLWNPAHYGWNSESDVLPNSKDKMKVFYDYVNNDLYITSWVETLLFSELIGNFVSRMSYINVDTIFNVGKEIVLFNSIDNTTSLYSVCSVDKDYNKFPDNNWDVTSHPSSISFIANQNSGLSKIFTNLNARVHVFGFADKSDNTNWGYLPHNFGFSKLEINNDYQSGEYDLENVKYKGMFNSLLKKKLNVWYLTLPRSEDGKKSRNSRFNSIWCKFKLQTGDDFVEKLVLNDLLITMYYN